MSLVKNILKIALCTGVLIGNTCYLGAQEVKKNPFSENVYQSIFYVNDTHGQLPTMTKINSAAAQFDAVTSAMPKVDAFRLSAGDIMIGANEKADLASAAFMNVSNLQATAVGNHEFDIGATTLAKVYETYKHPKLAANCTIPDKNPLKKQIISSMVLTGKTGEKYGLIGAQSPTLIERMKDKSLFEGIVISGGKKAYADLQKEVNKLQKQGINKIIMISHSGYEEEKEFAKNISGVDVIIGGHSHDLIFDITEGANLQYSPKGEPVVITQAGRDGKNFGILNVEYDKNGVIIKAQNNVFKTSDFGKGLMMLTATDVILGQSPVIAKIESIEPLTDRMNVEENPYIDVFMDMVKKETGVDIVLVNSANFRGGLEKGKVTERDISGIFPFKNKMCIVEIPEKNLIDALNFGGKSVLAPDLKPSIIQVSGMTYTMDKNGNVTYAAIIDKNGKKKEISVTNPSKDKIYTAAYDDYLANGGDGFKMMKDVKVLKVFDYDKDMIILQHLKKFNGKNLKSINIKRDGRIKFEN
ncbi:MAG: 5'-nucleotidase C-terminal domain-containing protein [Candidatus Gastranaerophilales bacterium]|nr:5'-nucleotidase C-terminal domain-containing protein [Candidatus Gastranaerophilales bacterium]